MLSLFLISALLVWALMTVSFAIAQIVKKNSIADIAWGMGFIMIAVWAWWQASDPSLQRIIITICVLLWGTRLAIYIFVRNRGKKEDWRYAQMKQNWKNIILSSYIRIFLLQGALMLAIATPILFADMGNFTHIQWFHILGVGIFAFGLVWETIGDWQLTQFKKNPNHKGKILTTGLWALSRHPNYFGEMLVWWGIWIISLNSITSLLTIIGPATITFVITQISTPMLEKKYADNPDFQQYCQTTNAFLPMK